MGTCSATKLGRPARGVFVPAGSAVSAALVRASLVSLPGRPSLQDTSIRETRKKTLHRANICAPVIRRAFPGRLLLRRKRTWHVLRFLRKTMAPSLPSHTLYGHDLDRREAYEPLSANHALVVNP